MTRSGRAARWGGMWWQRAPRPLWLARALVNGMARPALSWLVSDQGCRRRALGRGHGQVTHGEARRSLHEPPPARGRVSGGRHALERYVILTPIEDAAHYSWCYALASSGTHCPTLCVPIEARCELPALPDGMYELRYGLGRPRLSSQSRALGRRSFPDQAWVRAGAFQCFLERLALVSCRWMRSVAVSASRVRRVANAGHMRVRSMENHVFSATANRIGRESTAELTADFRGQSRARSSTFYAQPALRRKWCACTPDLNRCVDRSSRCRGFDRP